MTDGMELLHSLSLQERKKLTMTGAREVVSFDDTCVVVKTGLGMLQILGQDLKLKQLTPEGGDVTVEGEIGGLQYEQDRREGGWLGRFFR